MSIDARPSPTSALLEVAFVFLRFGFTAFGGPAAHIGMFQDEFVRRRKWLTDEQFLDLLGATNLIPGPNSTEMAIHLGYLRAGWPGLIAGGAGFILPAMLIVILFAWLYTRFGTTSQASWLMYGVKPVVIAIILQALWNLGRKAFKSPITILVGIGALVLYFYQVHPIPILIAGGLLVMLFQGRGEYRLVRAAWAPFILRFATLAEWAAPVAAAIPFSLPVLFLTFLKIGAVLYGSGYVLLAFLEADFVERLGWLTENQLIDAIAIGQVTPGPVFASASFIGFLLGGVPGALAATLGIFLPSFIFVAISNPFIPRLRSSPLASGLLDGVNAASLGLMTAVTIQLAQTAFPDIVSVVIGLIAGLLLFRWRVNTTWLILGGAVIGLVRSLL